MKKYLLTLSIVIFIGLYKDFNSIKAQASNRDNNTKLFIITVPKSGTWMLEKGIRLITHKQNALFRYIKEGILKGTSDEDAQQLVRPSLEVLDKCTNLHNNEFIIGHLSYKLEYEELLKKKGYKVLLLIRDPRDQLLSFAYYIDKYKYHLPGHYLSFNDLFLSLMGAYNSPLTRINNPLDFDKELNKVVSHTGQLYSFFLPWSKSSLCYTTRFELLVGDKGGGSTENQLQEIKNIAQFLDITISPQEVKEISENLFGGTNTFRVGQIGLWKKHFIQEDKERFKGLTKDLLVKLGYEVNNSW